MTKKAQVVMLASALPSPLHWDHKVGYMYAPIFGFELFYKKNNSSHEPHHLYFTTDDEIKEGDWVITQAGHLRQCTHTRPQGDKYICLYSDNLVLTTHCRKIVATTNPDLWNFAHDKMFGSEPYVVKYDVAKIPTDFIEAYVREQGKIKEVMLECEHQYQLDLGNGVMQDTDNVSGYGYDRLKLRSNGTVIIHKVQEKKYNISQCIDHIEHYLLQNHPDIYSKTGRSHIKNWFDQNYPE